MVVKASRDVNHTSKAESLEANERNMDQKNGVKDSTDSWIDDSGCTCRLAVLLIRYL